MKRLSSIILAVLPVLAVLSCNKEVLPVDVPDSPEDGSEIVFSADGFDVDVLTRAVTPVTSLNEFYCLATTGTPGADGETTSPGFTSTVFKKVTSGSVWKGNPTPMYWPASNPSYHFYAASKALTLSSGNVTFNPGTTITDDVYAYLPTPTYKTSNPLTFNHIYAQIGKCNITAPSGYSVSNLTVKVTPMVPTASATFNVRTGAWSSTSSHYTNGTETTLCTTTGSNTDNDLWLVPGLYTLTAKYTLSAGAYSESFTKVASVTIVMGANNDISATLPTGNAAQIEFTVTVTPWSTNNINNVVFSDPS